LNWRCCIANTSGQSCESTKEKKQNKKKVGTFPPRHRRKIRFRDAARSRGEIQLTKKKKKKKMRQPAQGVYLWILIFFDGISDCCLFCSGYDASLAGPSSVSAQHPQSHTTIHISHERVKKERKKAHSQLISRIPSPASLRDCGGEFSYFLLFDRKTFSFSKEKRVSEKEEDHRDVVWFGAGVYHDDEAKRSRKSPDAMLQQQPRRKRKYVLFM
jgi:hypothetical protein